MVGFLQNPTTEEAKKEDKEDIKIQSLSDSKKPSLPNDLLDLCIPELEDISLPFSDSFLDFDAINAWFMEGNPELGNTNMAGLEGNPVDFDAIRGELGDCENNFEVSGDGICKIDAVEEGLSGKEKSLLCLGQEKGGNGVVERSVEMASEGNSEEVDAKGFLGGEGSERNLGNLGCLIEKQLGKVNIGGASNCLVPTVAWKDCENVGGGVNCGGAGISDTENVVGGNENAIKIDESGRNEDESDRNGESEGESSSASSSSSSSSDSGDSDSSDDGDGDEDSGERSDEKKFKIEEGSADEQTDIEDGEVVLSDADEMVAWGDDGGGGGPIISKNEIRFLPSVPSVNVTLEPHHETLPVGTILSIIGPQVIVEGVEKHNPLNEGSILWVTESRLPLGIIDEIFGPVKNPYYIVRYNSESEVPPGIRQGSLISFVPEFANHILNDKSLYLKGYDASGENDEELSDGAEFSDDEKEAEYKRMLKMNKRGTNDSKPGNMRKEKRHLKNQKRNWNRNQNPAAQTPLRGDKLPVITEGQHFVPPVGASLNQDNHPSPSGVVQGLTGDQAVVPPFPLRAQAPGFSAPNWSNGFPHPQQQSLNLPTGLPANGMLWMQHNIPYQLYQTHLQTNAALQQQINTIPGLPANLNALGGQPNFGGAPVLAPWTTCLDQSVLNPLQFGMVLQGQRATLPLDAGQLAVQSQGPQINHNLLPSPTNMNFNQGRGGGSGGRRGHHRGRGRLRGGKGSHS